MTTQPEALRLADWLEDQYDPTYNQAQAAAELRRLHEAHDWQYRMAGERLRRVEKLEAQRDALLEALRLLNIECHQLHHNFKDRHDFVDPCPVVARIKAAIKAAEENT